MLTSVDVAEYFLAQADQEAGDLISNLKLQKLAYYAQGFHLALYNAPLFHEPIEAWTHGPVVSDLYHRYKPVNGNALPPPDNLDYAKYTPQVRELLDEVYNTYGQFSAWKLRNLTHEESPWKDTPTGAVIGQQALRAYFLTQIISDEQKVKAA